MNAEGYFRDVMPSDIEHIAPRLRLDDLVEIKAMSGHSDVMKILTRAVSVSSRCWTGCAADGEPMTLFGVAPVSLLSGIGSPWMLGTDRAQKYAMAMVREGRKQILQMLVLYPSLINYVDVRNVRSVRWLRRLGFEIHAPEPAGVYGLPFHKFTLHGDGLGCT